MPCNYKYPEHCRIFKRYIVADLFDKYEGELCTDCLWRKNKELEGFENVVLDEQTKESIRYYKEIERNETNSKQRI